MGSTLARPQHTQTATVMVDRNGWGRQIPLQQQADYLSDQGPVDWRHVHLLSTMQAEASGFEWARPIVWKPGYPEHLSVDRGMCQFNSHFFGWVLDREAYHWQTALDKAADICLDASRVAGHWSWKPILDRYWHGYGTPAYIAALGPARQALNL